MNFNIVRFIFVLLSSELLPHLVRTAALSMICSVERESFLLFFQSIRNFGLAASGLDIKWTNKNVSNFFQLLQYHISWRFSNLQQLSNSDLELDDKCECVAHRYICICKSWYLIVVGFCFRITGISYTCVRGSESGSSVAYMRKALILDF